MSMIGFESFSNISWNVRGTASSASRRCKKNLLEKFQPSVVVMVETCYMFGKVEKFWKVLRYKPISIAEARGHVGRV